MNRRVVALFVLAVGTLCAQDPPATAQDRAAERLYSAYQSAGFWYHGPATSASVSAQLFTESDGSLQATVRFEFRGWQSTSSWAYGYCQVPPAAVWIEDDGVNAGSATVDVDLDDPAVTCAYLSAGINRLVFRFVPTTGPRAYHRDEHANGFVSSGGDRYHLQVNVATWRSDVSGEIDGLVLGPFPDAYVGAERSIKITKEQR